VKRLISLLANLVQRRPIAVVLVTLLLTGVFGALSTRTVTASGQDGFSPETPEILAADRIGELFGDTASQSVMQVVVRSSAGDVITTEGLAATRAIGEALAAPEFADAIVRSPTQPGVVSYLAPVEQALAVQGIDAALLDDAAVRATYDAALAAAGEEGAFAAQLVSQAEDGSPDVGLVLVFLNVEDDLDAQTDREVAVADAIVAAVPDGDIEVRPFSFSLLFSGVEDFTAELGRLFGSAFAIIVAVLLFVYWLRPSGTSGRGRSIRRTLADMGVTMLTIIMAIVWMNGIGALLQEAGIIGPLTEIARIVPILLIGLGVDYGIHLISRYRDEVGSGRSVDEGVRRAIGTVGVALTLATVTTIIGFLTNVVNPIPALKDFGFLAAIGIAASFVLMLTFVPALRLILDRRAEIGGRLPVEGMGATSERALPRLMGRTAVLAERAPVPTLVVMTALGVLGYLGLANISTEFSFTDFLPDDAPAVQTLAILEEEFDGGFGETTQVIIEGDDLATPTVFNAIAESTAAMGDTPDVLTVPTPVGTIASVTSPASVVRGLFAPGPDGAPVAPAAAQAALAAGFDPVTGRVADDGDVAALYALAREASPAEMEALLHEEDGRARALLLEIGTKAGEDGALELRDALLDDLAPVRDTGATTVAVSQYIITGGIVQSLASSQVTSLLITLVAATLVLMLSFWIENRRPFLGVLTMIPVALVVLWTFGLMYVSGIPFGPVTATLTGLAVGIGVPYTIHMARRFEEDRVRFDDIEDAIRSTTTHTGGALAGSAFTTAGGFGILVTSSLTPFRQMGQVTSYAIVLSLFGAVMVLPSLLVLWERWHRRRGDAGTERPTVSLVDTTTTTEGAPV
jgi:predicted RND superfamily exporter protein